MTTKKKSDLELFSVSLTKLTFNFYTIGILLLTFLGYFLHLRNEGEDLDSAICLSYLYSISTVFSLLISISVILVVMYKHIIRNENK